jgi:hypothetical protein
MDQAQDLQLALNDFATDALSEVVSESTSLSISYEKLAGLLNQAEEIHKAREQGPGGGVKSGRKLKKRPRSSSPADQLVSDDEAVFRTQEKKALERAAAGDDDFRPTTRRRM